MNQPPYISIVVAACKGQVQPFLKAWTERLTRFGVSAEVIVAEGDGAKRNAAIRTARGEFILSTAIDLEFSDELMEFLAERRLHKGRLYRADLREGNLLHAREGSFPLTSEGFRRNAADDITGSESGIHFGEGWFPAEVDEGTGEAFRWMENQSQVVLSGPPDGGALAIEIEPGPGVGPLPHVLQALDSSGAPVAEWEIAGRASLRLWVPPAADGSRQTFRLSVPDGGRPLLDDLRILNFRVFRCDWVRSLPLEPRRASLPALRPILTRYVRSSGLAGLTRTVRLLRSVGPDVFGQGIEYWGSGWHRLEEAGAERFRWVSDDAELVVRCGQRDLCLLVEPGPSLNWRAFDLLIRLAGGETIGKVRVSGLTVARVPVPVLEGGVVAFSLAADRKGKPVAGDTRVLNFRVLACVCEPAKRETVEVRPSKAWTSVTVGQKPAAIDWPARVHAHRYELAEIGRPAFLHVNACEFILMDRDRWFDLRGLPEADYPPEYLNALFCYTAHFAGITEEVLREPLRIQRASPPAEPRAAMDADLVWLITQMRRLRAPAILTLDTWGAK